MIPVLDSFIGIIMKKLVDAGIKKIVRILEVERDMEALQTNIENIKLVLVDAESKKIESNSMALWLAELREVLYDVEDLLDYFADPSNTTSTSITENFLKYFPLKKTSKKMKISTIIGNINNNLDRIASKTSTLQLLTSQPNADKKVCRYNSSRITDTCSFQLNSKIVGIDDDATHLVDRITRDSDREHSVFAITGMGGIGKTTLARKVFNHDLIQKHFKNNIVWVCVSSNCTGEYLLKGIVRSIDKSYSESCVSLNELSSKLIEVVKAKKVFIVLDDIWDSRVWEKFLRVPLYTAAKHSRILITTRNQQVAMKMNAAHTHPVTEMNQRDGWSMLCKIVFEKKDNGDKNELADVGKKIVNRCKGLPLAINVMGGVLKMTDRTIAAWTRVHSSRTWLMQDLPEDILPSLLLSYEDLPSHLKRCFIYCSLFPQDFIFYRDILPYMWIAEGFIQKEEGTMMEESAEECYNELLMRNLLQVTPDSDGSSKCKMHDLLHSLAIFVSQNQYIYVDPKTFIGSSGLFRLRHLWLDVENKKAVPKEIIGQEYVRTLMLSTNTEIKEIPDDLLSGLRRLRVLDLGDIGIKTLPDSVGKMRQLRFLHIYFTELVSLPDSIKNLENLETLRITFVFSLREGNDKLRNCLLPKDIGMLCNLRHLLVNGVSKTLQNMPNGFDNLKRLRVLNFFVVNGRSEWEKSKKYEPNMNELKGLSELTDLSIYNLERVASKEEAEEAAIERKTSLKCLTLSCEPPPRIRDEDSRKIVEVFAGIKIPENLKKLSIDGFFGKQLPDHMCWSRLHQVKWLELKNCKLLKKLPSLGEFKFPKLQDFRLMEMEELENMFEVEQGAFPCLVNLLISGCPKLKSLGEGLQHATCLKKMTVRDVSTLESIENYSSISELEISWNHSLRSVRNLPSLKKMNINDCSALEVVKDVRELSSLSISSDEEVIPEWLKNTAASETWHWTVTDSEELVLMSRSKRVEVKINGVKVDWNFPGASEIQFVDPKDSEEFFDPVNDFMDVDNSRI